jgi:cellulose biosynthesis protein BcsQ
MLAETGRRVLVVDCDPQANLSETFGWVAERPGERLEDLLVVLPPLRASVRRLR